jgi:serine/threonine-protein kinase RsbW
VPAQSFKLTKSEGVAEGTTASYFIRDASEGPVCRLDPTTLTMGVDVLVESKIEGINSVVEELMRLLTSNCCSRKREFAVQTALREALANAVIHGNHGDTSKKVRVCCGCDSAKGILIVIRDEGEGFDPAKVPSPLIGEHVASEHGRGIFLSNMFMDETYFEDGGREIHMRKRGSTSH